MSSILNGLGARLLFVRVKLNHEEREIVRVAVKRKFGENYSLSNVIREALNLLLDIDLPLVQQGAPKGNRHKLGKPGANQYTVPSLRRSSDCDPYCVYCHRGRAKYKLTGASDLG